MANKNNFKIDRSSYEWSGYSGKLIKVLGPMSIANERRQIIKETYKVFEKSIEFNALQNEIAYIILGCIESPTTDLVEHVLEDFHMVHKVKNYDQIVGTILTLMKLNLVRNKNKFKEVKSKMDVDAHRKFYEVCKKTSCEKMCIHRHRRYVNDDKEKSAKKKKKNMKEGFHREDHVLWAKERNFAFYTDVFNSQVSLQQGINLNYNEKLTVFEVRKVRIPNEVSAANHGINEILRMFKKNAELEKDLTFFAREIFNNVVVNIGFALVESPTLSEDHANNRMFCCPCSGFQNLWSTAINLNKLHGVSMCMKKPGISFKELYLHWRDEKKQCPYHTYCKVYFSRLYRCSLMQRESIRSSDTSPKDSAYITMKKASINKSCDIEPLDFDHDNTVDTSTDYGTGTIGHSFCFDVELEAEEDFDDELKAGDVLRFSPLEDTVHSLDEKDMPTTLNITFEDCMKGGSYNAVPKNIVFPKDFEEKDGDANTAEKTKQDAVVVEANDEGDKVGRNEDNKNKHSSSYTSATKKELDLISLPSINYETDSSWELIEDEVELLDDEESMKLEFKKKESTFVNVPSPSNVGVVQQVNKVSFSDVRVASEAPSSELDPYLQLPINDEAVQELDFVDDKRVKFQQNKKVLDSDGEEENLATDVTKVVMDTVKVAMNAQCEVFGAFNENTHVKSAFDDSCNATNVDLIQRVRKVRLFFSLGGNQVVLEKFELQRYVFN